LNAKRLKDQKRDTKIKIQMARVKSEKSKRPIFKVDKGIRKPEVTTNLLYAPPYTKSLYGPKTDPSLFS